MQPQSQIDRRLSMSPSVVIDIVSHKRNGCTLIYKCLHSPRIPVASARVSIVTRPRKQQREPGFRSTGHPHSVIGVCRLDYKGGNGDRAGLLSNCNDWKAQVGQPAVIRWDMRTLVGQQPFPLASPGHPIGIDYRLVKQKEGLLRGLKVSLSFMKNQRTLHFRPERSGNIRHARKVSSTWPDHRDHNLDSLSKNRIGMPHNACVMDDTWDGQAYSIRCRLQGNHGAPKVFRTALSGYSVALSEKSRAKRMGRSHHTVRTWTKPKERDGASPPKHHKVLVTDINERRWSDLHVNLPQSQTSIELNPLRFLFDGSRCQTNSYFSRWILSHRPTPNGGESGRMSHSWKWDNVSLGCDVLCSCCTLSRELLCQYWVCISDEMIENSRSKLFVFLDSYAASQEWEILSSLIVCGRHFRGLPILVFPTESRFPDNFSPWDFLCICDRRYLTDKIMIF